MADNDQMPQAVSPDAKKQELPQQGTAKQGWVPPDAKKQEGVVPLAKKQE